MTTIYKEAKMARDTQERATAYSGSLEDEEDF